MASEESREERGPRACEGPDRYLRRRRPRIDPLAWGRFRVRVRGVLAWKRLLASLIRSRNLSPAVLLRFLAIFDSVRPGHDLHVLLGHRLLPQPGGFEGLRTVGERPHLDVLPVTRLDQPSPFGVNVCSELLAASAARSALWKWGVLLEGRALLLCMESSGLRWAPAFRPKRQRAGPTRPRLLRMETKSFLALLLLARVTPTGPRAAQTT